MNEQQINKVIEIIKNARVNKEQLYGLLINQLQSANSNSGELEKNIILHFLYVAIGNFDKAIEILGTIKEDIKGSLLNLRIAFIITIKSNFITQYSDRVARQYPDLTINDYLPLADSLSPVANIITLNNIFPVEEPTEKVDTLIASIISNLKIQSAFDNKEIKNKITSLLSFCTSNDKKVANYASIKMTGLLSWVKEHPQCKQLVTRLPMEDTHFIKLINETENYRIVGLYLRSVGEPNSPHINNVLVQALPLFDGFSKKGVWGIIHSSDIQNIIKGLLNRVEEIIKTIDSLEDSDQMRIVNFVKKLHLFFADDDCNKSSLKEEIKTCHKLTKDLLDWYKNNKNATGYYQMSQSYKPMMQLFNARTTLVKDQLQEIHVTANLFHLQLISNESEAKLTIKNLTDNLSGFNQWENQHIEIFKDAICSILDTLGDKPEILFELVKLVALVKSTDKNNKLDSFYQTLSTRTIESKNTLYESWQNAWEKKNTIDFFAPPTDTKKTLVAALQLISDAGILISPEHSRLLPRSGIGHNASFTQLSLN